MTSFDQIYLIGVIAAFAIFAVVLAWGDISTKSLRDGRKD